MRTRTFPHLTALTTPSTSTCNPFLKALGENNVTMRSTRAARMYEPGHWVSRISPTPLLMVVARRDTITLTDLALAAYERALQPKRLVTIQGGYFDPYLSQFNHSSAAALDWFRPLR